MSSKLLLRLAAFTMFVYYILHFISIPNKGMLNDTLPDSLSTPMTQLKINYIGRDTDFQIFYESNIYAFSMALALVFILLWMLSDLTEKYKIIAARLLIPFIFFLILLGGEELLYGHSFAGALSLISALLTGIAFFKMRGLSIKINLIPDED